MLALWFASARAFLAKVPWPIYAIAGALLLAWAWGNHRYSQGYDASEAKHARAAAQEAARAVKDDAKASDRRAADAVILTHDSNARKEAIANAKPDTTDAPGRALACQRLRSAGIDPPAECG